MTSKRTVEIDVELLDEVLSFAISHRDKLAQRRGTKAVVASMDEMIAKVNAILGDDSSTARRDRLMRETYSQESKRNADQIDGYDRDDLGESPDY